MSTEETKIYPSKCPVCGIHTNYVYRVAETKSGKTGTWFRCDCGVIFQSATPDGGLYGKEYLKSYESESLRLRYTTACKTYAPLIEKLTFGRQMLDVGYCIKDNMKEWEKRGWLTWGIDRNTAICEMGNIYKGDFLEYDFDIKVDKETLKTNTGLTETPHREFDFIYMGDVLEHFTDPLAALKKASVLLSGTGVLYISTPDIDFITKLGVPAFPFWRKDEHYVMWSERALKRELEKLGLKVIMCRRNFQACFHTMHNLHLIAQKHYF